MVGHINCWIWEVFEVIFFNVFCSVHNDADHVPILAHHNYIASCSRN